jgi:hypothetical protein
MLVKMKIMSGMMAPLLSDPIIPTAIMATSALVANRNYKINNAKKFKFA